LYGYGSPQLYSGLPKNIVDLINDIDTDIDDIDTDIDDETVKQIVSIKKYKDFAMRGRQPINPLTKFSFVFIDKGVVKITELGNKLIRSSQDFGDVFLLNGKYQILQTTIFPMMENMRLCHS
jgi:hypothetical protein